MNWDTVNQELQDTDWDTVLQSTDYQLACDNFYHVILKLIDKHAPSRKCRIKNKVSPWMTTEILTLIRERNELKLKARKSHNEEDWTAYKTLRNKTTMLIRQRKT